ncbi:MAG: SDR family oxidoreductase [Pseudomonadota bacterium]
MTTVLITGASRGLGLEHARQFAARGFRVVATCRSRDAPGALGDVARAHGDDVEILDYEAGDLASADRVAAALGGTPIDILINNAGIYGAANFVDGMEAQSLGSIDYENWRNVLQVNLLAPMRLTEALIENIAASERRIVAMMSSDLGSIENNRMGQSYAYRSSKAALNMMTKGLSVNLKERGVIAVSLAPGWCRTDLGGDIAEIDPADSVRGQQAVLDQLTLDDTGRFINWMGQDTPW